MDDAQLMTIWQQRRPSDTAMNVGQPLAMLMKHHIGKRVKRLGELGAIWDEVLPDEIREHTALEDFNRGVLKVVVDSAPRRFELNMLLKGGIEKEIRSRFSGALNKIKLIPGQFYTVDKETGDKRYHF